MLKIKNGHIDDADARIGWVIFSKSDHTIYFHRQKLKRLKGGGISSNFFDEDIGEEDLVSGIKKRGSNANWAEAQKIQIDADSK